MARFLGAAGKFPPSLSREINRMFIDSLGWSTAVFWINNNNNNNYNHNNNNEKTKEIQNKKTANEPLNEKVDQKGGRPQRWSINDEKDYFEGRPLRRMTTEKTNC